MLLKNAFCVFEFLWISAAAPRLNSYEICRPTNTFTYDSNGILTTPKYSSNFYGNANCNFHIYFPAGINIQIDINGFYTSNSEYQSYLAIYTSNTTLFSTRVALLQGNYETVTFTYNLLSNAWFNFWLYDSSSYGRFRLTWKAMPEYPISSSLKKSDCQGPDVMFLLDRSQAIFPDFYNNSIKDFLRKMASQYSFLDDITKENPFSSKFGIIEFSDNAAVSLPLDKYTRVQFYWRLQNNTGYGSGGVSNVTAALSLAYDEFLQHGSPSDGDNIVPKMIVLVVNDISSFDLKQASAAMNKLKKLIQLPIGIIVPGLPGIVPGSQTRLGELLVGNANWRFGSLDSAVTGIPALTNSTFKCPYCTDLIFICEMTAAIGYDTKLQCLQLAQKLALAANQNSKRKYAIALYGVQIYHSIVLQEINEFNVTINQLIQNLEEQNLPNGGQSYLAPFKMNDILNQLCTTLGNSSSSKIGVTIIMGELSVIKDPNPANAAAQKVAKLNSDIFVLDETRFGPPSSIWTTLTNNQPNHIVNATSAADIEDFFETLLQDLQKSQC
uniref:VWFA domain-containing protein n=1 Tax=Panagrolaimus sp. PS1159 TaxID=55785 RepID=A0AC35EVQ7_9BILA